MEPTYYRRRLVVALCLSLGITFSCSSPNSSATTDQKNKLEVVDVEYATGLRIWENESIYHVEVRNPQDTLDILGAYDFSKTAVNDESDTISTPISTIALNSTTFGAYFTTLGSAEMVRGMTYLDRVMNRELKARESAGTLVELTSAGELDFEKVLALNPDVLMAYSYGESNFERIKEHGIPVVLNMEYMESTPLGRAEWVKLAGCLTGQFSQAVQVFDSIETSYNALKQKAMLSSYSPDVFTGSRYKDFWYAPGNDSYIAHYIRDAGANYSFQQYPGNGSQELEYEAALESISQADFWGLVVFESEPFTIDKVLDMNDMYGNFESYKAGNVFVCNATLADYFGDAVMEPHIILADLISIFHPEYVPNHTPKYFHDLVP